jgi:signal peptidase II
MFFRSALMDRLPTNRFLLFAIPASLGCAADLLTKAWMFSWPELRDGGTHWFWTGHVGLQLSWNEGALFGMGQGMVWLFAALSVAAAIAIPVWLFWCGVARDALLTVALGSVMGGVLGNLYDRLGLHGEVWPAGARADTPIYAVRDWILWQLNDRWRWPNFNIADSLLVVGACAIFFHLLRQPASPEIQPGEAASSRLRPDASGR